MNEVRLARIPPRDRSTLEEGDVKVDGKSIFLFHREMEKPILYERLVSAFGVDANT